MNGMNGGGMNVNGNISNQNSPGDMCNPKRQAVFDRLKKRMGTYRKRQVETVPRFDQTFTGICEQQSIETNVLQKRFIETKAKRVAKKADKKSETAPTGSLNQSKQMKRPAHDDLENDDVHPTAPKQMAGSSSGPGNNAGMDNMKFQVEIVQQLEFTASTANIPQQISTNVTVKTTTNGIKYEPQEMKGMKMEPGKMQQSMPALPPDLLQDLKQEPDNEFADLDFGGIANFMGNDEHELKKLFSNIGDVFDQDLFDSDKIKQEPRPTPPLQQQQMPPQMPQPSMNQMNQIPQQFNEYVLPDPSMQMQKPMMHQQPPQMQQQQQFNRMYQNVPQQMPQQQQQQPPPQQQQQMPEMSPAAQTLKNMAQQHQRSTLEMRYMRPQAPPQQMNAPPQMMNPQMNQQQPNLQQRVPYQQQQMPPQMPPQQQQQPPQQQQQFTNDFASNQFNKNQMQMPFPPEMIKQEMMMQQQQQPPQMHQQHQMKSVMSHQMMMGQNDEMKMSQQYQQQYQNTLATNQFITNLPPQQQQQQQQQRNNFNPNQNSMNIHMKQTQMMHIQQNNNGNIQMQGAQHQHMHFTGGEMKINDNSNFSMQQQQNMYFNHHNQQHAPYGNMQAMQKRPPHGDGPNNFNMMQSQQMSFTQ